MKCVSHKFLNLSFKYVSWLLTAFNNFLTIYNIAKYALKLNPITEFHVSCAFSILPVHLAVLTSLVNNAVSLE